MTGLLNPYAARLKRILESDSWTQLDLVSFVRVQLWFQTTQNWFRSTNPCCVGRRWTFLMHSKGRFEIFFYDTDYLSTPCLVHCLSFFFFFFTACLFTQIFSHHVGSEHTYEWFISRGSESNILYSLARAGVKTGGPLWSLASHTALITHSLRLFRLMTIQQL